jgi:hypothetical protein
MNQPVIRRGVRILKPEMPDLQETSRKFVAKTRSAFGLLPAGGTTAARQSDGGRWWFRTTDLHDVNVALYP